MAWQVGKTAASIRFVNDISRLDKAALTPDELERLENAAEKIRNGEVILKNFLEIDDFLKHGFGT